MTKFAFVYCDDCRYSSPKRNFSEAVDWINHHKKQTGHVNVGKGITSNDPRF